MGVNVFSGQGGVCDVVNMLRDEKVVTRVGFDPDASDNTKSQLKHVLSAFAPPRWKITARLELISCSTAPL